jgi:hypothetical protein
MRWIWFAQPDITKFLRASQFYQIYFHNYPKLVKSLIQIGFPYYLYDAIYMG